MIPDEAVEAAWDAFSMGRDGMRAALKAAVPHMLAEVQASAIENAANNCGDERTGAWLRFHAAGIRQGRLAPQRNARA